MLPNAERPPGGRGAQDDDHGGGNVTSTIAVAAFTALSDERDISLRLRNSAYREGYAAAAAQFTDHYQRGVYDGITGYKAAQHGIVRDLKQHLLTWDGLRENFSQPRARDYPGGGPLPSEAPPGMVWLSGPPVHYHQCTSGCYSYGPGWYPLPGGDAA